MSWAPCTPSRTWTLPVLILVLSYFTQDDAQLLTAPCTTASCLCLGGAPCLEYCSSAAGLYLLFKTQPSPHLCRGVFWNHFSRVGEVPLLYTPTFPCMFLPPLASVPQQTVSII